MNRHGISVRHEPPTPNAPYFSCGYLLTSDHARYPGNINPEIAESFPVSRAWP
jgi:hypothetical protein